MNPSILRLLREPDLPPTTPLAPAIDKAVVAVLAIFGFFLPFSVAGVSISMALLLVLSLLCAPAMWRAAPWRDPVVAVGLLLFAVIAAQTLWVSGPGPQGRAVINQYHELLMAPFLLALFRLVSKPKAFLYGLITGSVLYAAFHWLALGMPQLEARIAARSISAGLILTLTAYVALEQARTAKHPRLLYIVAAFLAVTVLWRVQGRTGQVIFAFMVAYVIWSRIQHAWRIVPAVIVPVVLLAVAVSYGAANRRLHDTMTGLSHSADASTTSTFIRIKMLETSLDMAKDHFLTGIGIARYADVSETYARARELHQTGKVGPLQPWARTTNPHNEYLLQLVGVGVLSLALFVGWLALPAMRRHAGKPVTALVAVSGAFAIGSLFNSMLLDFTEAHFYVALMTWLLAQAGAGDSQAAAPAKPATLA